jgi:hypothetical protein
MSRMTEVELLAECLPLVRFHIRKNQRSWIAAIKRGDEFHTKKHCERMNHLLELEAQIQDRVSNE